MGKIKGWKRDWNIGDEFPEWISIRENVMSIFEGDGLTYSVAVGYNNSTKYLGTNVSKKEAMRLATNYMRGHPNG